MITGVVRDRSTTSVLKVCSLTSMTEPSLGAAVSADCRRLLPALRGRLPRTQIDGTVE